MNYYGQSGRYDKKRKFGLLGLLDFVMLLVSILFALLLLAAFAARWVSPEKTWIFAFATLIAPITYIVNIILLLFWVLRWKIYVMVPAIVLLLGMGNITMFFRPSISKHYQEKSRLAVTVMTYNVAGFLYNETNGMPYASSLDSIASFIRSVNPDIICFQEFQTVSSRQKMQVDSLLGIYNSVVNYRLENSNGGGWGTAVYSKYPIVNSGKILFENSTNSAVWADMVIRQDTVRVFSNHLQTTEVNSSDREYINSQQFIYNLPDRDERVKNMMAKMARNYRVRAAQADSIAPLIRRSPYPTIVCGDFNDTPMSYIYFKMRGDLTDTFVKKGEGISNTNTFKGLFNIFRIDYIFHSVHFKTLNYNTPEIIYSDHKPVYADIEFKNSRR